jgi:hypothetical protein
VTEQKGNEEGGTSEEEEVSVKTRGGAWREGGGGGEREREREWEE